MAAVPAMLTGPDDSSVPDEEMAAAADVAVDRGGECRPLGRVCREGPTWPIGREKADGDRRAAAAGAPQDRAPRRRPSDDVEHPVDWEVGRVLHHHEHGAAEGAPDGAPQGAVPDAQ